MKRMTINHWLGRGLIFAALALSWTSAELSAKVIHGSDFNFTGGLRRDRITSNSLAFSKFGEVLFSKYIKQQDIDLYTLGANFRYEFGEKCCHMYTIPNHFFLRGHANLGWIGSSRYHATTTTSKGKVDHVRARQHKGKTQDFQGGIGYLGVVCTDNFRAGPIIGWAYNLQRFTTKRAKRNGNYFPIEDGTSYRTRWRGPFLGLDFIFRECDFSFECGYEFHWAKMHAQWSLRGHDIPFLLLPQGYFSNHQKANHAYGNIFWAKWRWDLFDGFVSGIGAKYTDFRTKAGHIKPINGDFHKVHSGEIFQYRLRKVTWTSMEFWLELGYRW